MPALQLNGIDLAPFLFGRVQKVSALVTPGKTNSYLINLMFINGAVGQLAITNRLGHSLEEIVAVGSSMTSVRVSNSIEMTAYKRDQPFRAHKPSFIHGYAQGSVEQGFVGELQEFVDAIIQNCEPESGIDEATHTMAIYDAIQQSIIDNGRVLELADF